MSCKTCARQRHLARNPSADATGDTGDGTVGNDSPYAHWTYTYNATQAVNSYTCARADSSLSYDTYTGAFPWEASEQELPEDDNSTATTSDTALQMANATFFQTTAGQNKWVAARQLSLQASMARASSVDLHHLQA